MRLRVRFGFDTRGYAGTAMRTYHVLRIIAEGRARYDHICNGHVALNWRNGKFCIIVIIGIIIYSCKRSYVHAEVVLVAYIEVVLVKCGMVAVRSQAEVLVASAPFFPFRLRLMLLL